MTSAPVPQRSYAGVPQQARRDMRRARLLEAAMDQVGSDGLVSLTLGSVCARARLAKRYFYESFASIDDLVSAALAQVFASVGDEIDASGLDAESSPQAVLEIAVRGALGAMDDRRAARLYLESAGTAAGSTTRASAVDALVTQLLGRVVGPAEPSAAERLTGHLLVSGATHVLALWLQGELDLTRDEIIQLLVEHGSAAATRMRRDANRPVSPPP